MKIFVAGSLNMDLVIKSSFMPENGMTVSGSDFMTNPGGKGANQAVAAGKLGAETYMVGCVGDSFGDQLINTLSDYGVHTDYVIKKEGVSSGIAVIVIVDGDNRIILDSGANAKITTEDIDQALAIACPGDYMICQLEIPQEIVSYAFEKSKEKGLITVLNPAPAAKLMPSILKNTDWLIPNQTEARFYTDIYPEDKQTSMLCAQKLAEFGVKNILVTMGASGSASVSNGEYIKVDGCKINAIDTTAAGDTYVGAFVTCLSQGNTVKDAMLFATKASALTCTKRGAIQAIPFKKDVDEFNH